MDDPIITSLFNALLTRNLENGGFSTQPGRDYRPDATAWAILGLSAIGTKNGLIDRARARLATDQLKDGRISMSREHPEAYWPTPLAVLAWQGSPAHQESQSRAIRFLLKTTGLHWPKKQDSPASHDTSIKGWSWTENTHSWIEPTALALLALKTSGYGDHERARESVRMLMDRQLPKGGWNYGNTFVFGQELNPMPDTTGIALNALSGHVPREQISRSLEYLKVQVARLRSPLALSWSLLGLGAWGEQPTGTRSWVEESLNQQKKFGTYDTTSLSLLILALMARGPLTPSLSP